MHWAIIKRTDKLRLRQGTSSLTDCYSTYIENFLFQLITKIAWISFPQLECTHFKINMLQELSKRETVFKRRHWAMIERTDKLQIR